MGTWHERPWLRFFLLGGALVLLEGLVLSPPKPVLGPLGESRLAGLKAQWRSQAGRDPSSAQLRELVSLELENDLLLQEALKLQLHREDHAVYERLLRDLDFLGLAEGLPDRERFERALSLGLHLDDEVVRQRMIFLMEQRLLDSSEEPAISPEALETAFGSRQSEFRIAPRLAFAHVYFSTDDPLIVRRRIEPIRRDALGFEEARPLGDPFIVGDHLQEKSLSELGQIFGSLFQENLEAALLESAPQIQSWYGPIRSALGFHYLWVEAFEAGKEAAFAEVEPKLRRELELKNRENALKRAKRALADQYHIQTDVAG
jgi:hypothetical protein